MYCRKCGAENPDEALRCSKCGEPLQPAMPGGPVRPTGIPGQEVPNYLTFAILVTIPTLICCLPLPVGVVAIIFGAQVNSKLAAGDYAGAAQASKVAKILCWVTLGLELFIGLIYLILIFGGMLEEFGKF